VSCPTRLVSPPPALASATHRSSSLGVVKRSPLHRHHPRESTPVRTEVLPSAWACHVPDSFRSRRSSRPQRFSPRATSQVCCTLQPVMGFASFQVGARDPKSPCVHTLPRGVITLQSFPLAVSRIVSPRPATLPSLPAFDLNLTHDCDSSNPTARPQGLPPTANPLSCPRVAALTEPDALMGLSPTGSLPPRTTVLRTHPGVRQTEADATAAKFTPSLGAALRRHHQGHAGNRYGQGSRPPAKAREHLVPHRGPDATAHAHATSTHASERGAPHHQTERNRSAQILGGPP
jgi:hypothetical protein